MDTPKQVNTWIADFTMAGRLAYLSHQETLTLFQRALVRAGVPLVFSAGFNPRPHLSLPLPRSVGVQSDAERICATVEYAELPEAERVGTDVQRQLPEGCTLRNASFMTGKAACQPSGYELRFCIVDSLAPERLDHVRACLAEQRTGGPLLVQRFAAKRNIYKPFDIAPFIETAELTETHTIHVRCRVSPEGTVRVDELMQWLKLQPEDLRQPVRRTAIYWN
jgi:radical SAM-linked protein